MATSAGLKFVYLVKANNPFSNDVWLASFHMPIFELLDWPKRESNKALFL